MKREFFLARFLNWAVFNLIEFLFMRKEIWMFDKTYDLKKYLFRYHIFNNKYFGLYLHNIHMSDLDRDAHNHPWSFRTLILKGEYLDTQYISSHPKNNDSTYFIEECDSEPMLTGMFKLRHWSHIHKVILTNKHTPVWTLVLRGSKKIENANWGFFTQTGFMNSDDYIQQNPDSRKIIKYEEAGYKKLIKKLFHVRNNQVS